VYLKVCVYSFFLYLKVFFCLYLNVCSYMSFFYSYLKVWCVYYYYYYPLSKTDETVFRVPFSIKVPELSGLR
jgi:hypothetical protein